MKKEIKEFLFINEKFISKRSRKEYFEKHNKINLYNEILNSYGGSYSLRESVMLILTDSKTKICKICKKPSLIHINGGKVNVSNYCSNVCKNKDMAFIMKDIIPNRDEVATQKKREQTLFSKTGFKFNSQRPELKHYWKKSKLSSETLDLLSDKNWLVEQYKKQSKSSQQIAKEIGTHYGTVLAAIDSHDLERNEDYQRSFAEETIANEVKTFYSDEIIFNDKLVLKPKHIDLYFPKKNFGIEIDGLYWHSSGDKDSSKLRKLNHVNKTDSAQSNGIFLMHITDLEVSKKMPLVLSMIKSRLGVIENKIYARKCTIKVITSKESRDFFESSHISGYSNASVHLALIYDGEIVQAISLNKPRFSKEADWVLVRFATKIDHSVVGGFQKLLRYFRQNNTGSILSYCDKRYGSGKVYELAGFDHVRTTSPGYFWTSGSNVLSRYQTQKSKLQTLLGVKFTVWTEDETMFSAKYRKFLDCGHKVFFLK